MVKRSTIIAGLMVIGVLTAGFSAYSHMTEKPKYTIRYDYTVRYGDTLWDIANQFKDESQDVREEVFMIAKFNGLDANKPLQPGTNLRIEVYR